MKRFRDVWDAVPYEIDLEKFKAAGKEYAENLTLSEETVKSLETPMLPNKVYIQIVNAQAAMWRANTNKLPIK